MLYLHLLNGIIKWLRNLIAFFLIAFYCPRNTAISPASTRPPTSSSGVPSRNKSMDPMVSCTNVESMLASKGAMCYL